MAGDKEETAGYASFSIPKELAEMIKSHLQRHGDLLGRPKNRVGPFLAEGARILMQQDLDTAERLLRMEKHLEDEGRRGKEL